MISLCACGKPLHYSNPAEQARVEQLCNEQGSYVPVVFGARRWLLQRHYIALHGIKLNELARSKFPELVKDGVVLISYLHDNGGLLVAVDRPSFEQQMFTHTDLDGVTRHFDIAKLKRMIQQHKLPWNEFHLDAEQAEFVLTHHGIDEEHLATRMTEAFLAEPGIMCVFPDGSQLTVDGNHRLVARTRRNMETMSFWMVPELVWRKALLAVPDGFMA